MKSAIRVDGLVKSYGGSPVPKGISFDVGQGEIFALLGANGAGKTTTLECIEGLRRYDGGDIEIEGSIGVQLQSSSLAANIKAIEAVRLFSRWGRAVADASLLKALGIDEIKNKLYRDMSTGQKRRLHLALALVGDPDILFLDEPTAGLDVEGRVSLHQEIRRLKSRGKTIIMASHDMAEVEDLCDRIAILRDGELAFVGTAGELTERVGFSYVIRIETERGEETVTADNITDALLERLGGYRREGVSVLDIRVERPTLEQRFIDMIRRDS
jgi:ABC-2 type transport system ATP-binding protein